MNNSRILILRPDNIGDVILFCGALKHIRALYPNAQITLAVQEHIVNLVELCPYVDSVTSTKNLTWWEKFSNKRIPLKRHLKRSIHFVNKLYNIYKSKYDVVLFSIKSPDICQLEILYSLNIKKAYGIAGCNVNTQGNYYLSGLRPEVLFTNYLDVSYIDQWQHELFITLNYLKFLGCSYVCFDDILPCFWLSDLDKDFISKIQKSGKKIIGLFPCASLEIKRWEIDNYGVMAKLLDSEVIYVIFGSSTDTCLSDQVATAIRKHRASAEIVNLAGRTTLRDMAKTIKSCDLLIGVDTAGLHMAVAFNVPSIGIVGGGHYGRFVPWGDADINVFLTFNTDCFHCNWICNMHDVKCINGVLPDDVAVAANRLLSLSDSSKANQCSI